MTPDMIPGAVYLGDGRTRFIVWAPYLDGVAVHLLSPVDTVVPLEKDSRGYHTGTVGQAGPGCRYVYVLNGETERPDPASRFQPEGVHGPSEVIDPGYAWVDGGWKGLPLEDYVIYELHTGTFSPEGTFAGISPQLDRLKDLGITAVELMPVAQFPGSRNWGYDGVYPYAVQDSYGGPDGLKRLVDACHGKGLAVVLDVVYNHLGPEGNYLGEYGPYFTDSYHTPWGSPLNFDGPDSDEVRRFFIANALYWLEEFHIDALRLDALHAIFDHTPYTFIEQLAFEFQARAGELGRKAFLIAESSANDSRLVRDRERGGYGYDAQWNDDFHHALHTILTGEKGGYYRDYGKPEHLLKAFREGFVYSGEYSLFRRRRHGTSSRDLPASRFVVFSQNHDQVGNRAGSERLSSLIEFEGVKLAAGLVMLSPFIPLLFMGEEYGETAPFNYFVSHSDPALIEAVRKGRRAEFASFNWNHDMPDPQDEGTFLDSRLDFNVESDDRRALYSFYRELLRLRREMPALSHRDRDSLEAEICDGSVLCVFRQAGEARTVLCCNLAPENTSCAVPLPEGNWRKIFDSSEEKWLGPGSGIPETVHSAGSAVISFPAHSCIVLNKEI